jgi:hypothetical protein
MQIANDDRELKMPRKLSAVLTVVSVVGVTAAITVTSAVAQRLKPKTTGVFSNMEYHKDSGDVSGIEVFIVNTKHGYMATVQIAEGEPDAPILVPVTQSGDSLSFEVPSAGAKLLFTGTVKADGLYGHFNNGAFSDRSDGRFMLRRGRSYWQ